MREVVRALGKDPNRWHIVHALPRSKKEHYPSNVKHDFIDRSGSVSKLESIHSRFPIAQSCPSSQVNFERLSGLEDTQVSKCCGLHFLFCTLYHLFPKEYEISLSLVPNIKRLPKYSGSLLMQDTLVCNVRSECFTDGALDLMFLRSWPGISSS